MDFSRPTSRERPSRPGSRASSLGPRPGSRNTTYRTVNRTADVDESLFGGAANRTRSANPGDRDQEVTVVGKDTVVMRRRPPVPRSARQAGGYPSSVPPSAREGACIIGASELNRLRENAKLLSKEEEAAQKARQEAEHSEKMEKAAARKEKIRQIEEERRRKALEVEAEREGRAKKNPFQARAEEMQTEQLDDVKQINQVMQMSKVVTIRDRQMAEKAAIAVERDEEEKELDAMMEIDRLKKLKMYEERDRERHEQVREGSKVIVEQIKDRHMQRMRAEEERDQERNFVLKQMAALKEEEIEQHKQKQLAAKRLMDEVNAVNAAAMKIKEDKMLAEKIEEDRIVEYMQAKEQRDREEDLKREEAQAARERETARLRGLQEKAQDKAAEMDALRAKRATAAAERVTREKEKKERERLAGIQRELHDSRVQQQAEKEARLGEQARAEREEFDRIVELQLRQEEAEQQKEAEQKALRDKHSEELRSQIQAREEKAYQERRDFLEHGNQMKAQQAAERRKLEVVKSKKIEEMQKMGISEKYYAKLNKKTLSA